MKLIPLTQDLEEKARKGLVPEEEIALLDEEKTPASLLDDLGKYKLSQAIGRIILEYRDNGSDKGAFRQFTSKFFNKEPGNDDISLDIQQYILNELIKCSAGRKRTIIRKLAGSSNKPELNLMCNLRQEYVGISGIINNCCGSDPNQSCEFYKNKKQALYAR